MHKLGTDKFQNFLLGFNNAEHGSGVEGTRRCELRSDFKVESIGLLSDTSWVSSALGLCAQKAKNKTVPARTLT